MYKGIIFDSNRTFFQIPKSVFYSTVIATDVDWLYTNPSPFALTPGAEFVAKADSQCNLLGSTDNTALVQWLYDYSLFSYLDNELEYLSKWSGGLYVLLDTHLLSFFQCLSF